MFITIRAKACVYHQANHYDAADRLTATATPGTNGGSAWTRPSSVPSASGTILVTSYTYNAAGWVDSTTDPRGIVDKAFYDNLGRVTKTIANYTNGTPTNSSNQTTEYGYDGNDNTTYVQVDLPGSAIQKTFYLYGVTTSAGSGVNSNDILSAVEYPDPTTGAPSTTAEDTYTVNALGQPLTFTDRNGSQE